MNRLAMEVKEALKEAGIALSDITTACLIGGWYDFFIIITASAVMPSVKETMQSLFKNTLTIATHPDEVIAEGAVIQATLRLEHKRSFHFTIQTLLFSTKDTSTYSAINDRYSLTDRSASTGDCGGG